MHVSWGWIKQRPHFIAENLSNYYYVNLFHFTRYVGLYLVKNQLPKNINNFKKTEVFKLPFERYNFVKELNSSIIKIQVNQAISKSDLLWVTHPNLYESIGNLIPNNLKVIYDCMDDSLEFPKVKANPYLRNSILKSEEKLIERSELIFTSSDYLKSKLLGRYKNIKNVYVINNALNLVKNNDNNNQEIPFSLKNRLKITGLKLMYIGTISEWIDLDIILESLEKFKNIIYIFIGPKNIKLPKHDRLLFFGPVEHKHLYHIMEFADALIMPFKINELVMSVNPVKIYEYVSSLKPSIVVKYPETLQFKDYVYLYNNRNDYLDLIEKLVNNDLPAKITSQENIKFVLNNSWEKRVEKMVKIIDEKN